MLEQLLVMIYTVNRHTGGLEIWLVGRAGLRAVNRHTGGLENRTAF